MLNPKIPKYNSSIPTHITSLPLRRVSLNYQEYQGDVQREEARDSCRVHRKRAAKSMAQSSYRAGPCSTTEEHANYTIKTQFAFCSSSTPVTSA